VFSLDAVVELVADGGLGMGEETVTSGAVVVRFGGFCKGGDVRGWRRRGGKYLRSSVRSPQSTLKGWSHLLILRIKGSKTKPSGQSFSTATPSSHW
jgi:hypothetical protein